MTTLKQRQARLAKIMQIVELDAAGFILRQPETENLVRRKFKVSRDGAQMLVVQAARRLRYEHQNATDPQPATLTIPEAALLASALVESGSLHTAPGESAIRRAALLGQIPTAQQDGGRRWTFQRTAVETWLLDPDSHRPGRKTKKDE